MPAVAKSSCVCALAKSTQHNEDCDCAKLHCDFGCVKRIAALNVSKSTLFIRRFYRTIFPLTICYKFEWLFRAKLLVQMPPTHACHAIRLRNETGLLHAHLYPTCWRALDALQRHKSSRNWCLSYRSLHRTQTEKRNRTHNIHWQFFCIWNWKDYMNFDTVESASTNLQRYYFFLRPPRADCREKNNANVLFCICLFKIVVITAEKMSLA